MKFSIDKQRFSEKLALVQGIAERRATMPILSHVFIEAKNNKIKITSTDLETTLSTWTDATVEVESNIAVPARKLFEIIKELPDGEVDVQEIKNSWIEITTPSATFKIAGLPGEDFPIVPEVSSNGLFSIDSSLLEDMISKTIYCVSPDELRRNLAGIYFEKTPEDKLRLIATDGHRLSFVEKSFEEKIELKNNVLVPKKAVSELRKLLRHDEKIQIGCGKNFFISMSDDVVLFSRLIDADFPDYKQVVPESTSDTLNIDKDQFLSALKRVCIFSSERTRSVKLNLSKDLLTLVSISPEVGEARESIHVSFNGEEKEIGFNGGYLIDVLETIEGSNINFSITDELSPTVITPDGMDNYKCVVMPMRV